MPNQFSSLFYYIEALFFNGKININGVYVVKKETRQEGFVQF